MVLLPVDRGDLFFLPAGYDAQVTAPGVKLFDHAREKAGGLPCYLACTCGDERALSHEVSGGTQSVPAATC